MIIWSQKRQTLALSLALVAVVAAVAAGLVVASMEYMATATNTICLNRQGVKYYI